MSKAQAEKTTDTAAKATDKKRQRSPNYPAVGLRNAVERAKKLYDADGKPGSSPAAAFSHIGFTSGHGQAQAVLAGLKKFGLLEDKGGRVVPTKGAIDVFEYAADHDRHKAALREMALKPAIYLQLVKTFQEHSRLPSDASLKPELITDKGFNPKAVDGFLADFRDSLTYAGLLEGNDLKLSGVELDSPEDVVLLDRTSKSVKDSKPLAANTGKPAVSIGTTAQTMKLPVTLPSLRVAWFEVPFPLNELDFASLSAALTSFKDALIPPTPPPPKKADEEK